MVRACSRFQLKLTHKKGYDVLYIDWIWLRQELQWDGNDYFYRQCFIRWGVSCRWFAQAVCRFVNGRCGIIGGGISVGSRGLSVTMLVFSSRPLSLILDEENNPNYELFSDKFGKNAPFTGFL